MKLEVIQHQQIHQGDKLMAKFAINIKEIHSKTLIVEAENYEKAEAIVEGANNECFIDLYDYHDTHYETEYTDDTLNYILVFKEKGLNELPEDKSIKRYKERYLNNGNGIK